MRKKLNASVKIEVLGRAAPLCEICLQPAAFARYTDIEGKRVGRFAHIRATSTDGPRHDSKYPKEFIDSAENLFWCCTDCHDIVDLKEKWDMETLMNKLNETRAKKESKVELIIEGEINVEGEEAEEITGINAGGKATVLKPGTIVNVKGIKTKKIFGVRNQ